VTAGFAAAAATTCFVPDDSAAIFSDPAHPVVEPASPTAAATPVLLLRKDLRDCFETESDRFSFMLYSFRNTPIIFYSGLTLYGMTG
jgi:hypothetical protein